MVKKLQPALILAFLAGAFIDLNAQQPPIVLSKQGSFAAGGKVIKSEGTFDPLKPWFEAQGGQTRHGDHADVFYQVPRQAKQYPLVFLHGYGQSRRSWQTTADGREGFADKFLRNGYPVYLVDQPGRGAAGQTTTPVEIKTTPDDQTWYTQFRIGLYPKFNEGVQFPKDENSLNQFFRMMTPNTGNVPEATIINSLSAVFDSTGDGILFTHSASGIIGWKTALKNNHIKGIVAYEPGGLLFPEGQTPAGNRGGTGVPLTEFKKLTKIPIVVYYGDFIPEKETEYPSLNFWRTALTTARQWAKLVNAHGGDVTIVHLPEIGIKGNTHFLMSDLNNDTIASLTLEWLQAKGLADANTSGTSTSPFGNEVIELSKKKWDWMADKDVDKLADLFHEKSKFVHMGGSWGKERELEVIRSGGIHYKKADIENVEAEIIDNIAIVLSRIKLLAVVGGNEVTNLFTVTEVYQKTGNDWKLLDLTFSTRIMPSNKKNK